MGNFFKSSTQKATNTVDPYKNMPSWLKAYYQQDTARGSQILDQAFDIAAMIEQNPEIFMDLSDDEVAAIDALISRGGASADLFNRAGDLSNLREGYMSPYTNQVVETTLASMDRASQREQAARGASAASIGGLNSTRAAVADAVSQSLYGMDRARTEAGLRDAAFARASDMAMGESGRLESLGRSAMDAQALVSQAQATRGEAQRRINQSRENAARTAGRDASDWLSTTFAAVRNPAAPHGGTTTAVQPGPSPFQKILGTASQVAGIWAASDETVKEGVGGLPVSGLEALRELNPRTYVYIDEMGDNRVRRTGLMAQDVQRAGIEGGVAEIDGVLHVEPYAVLATVVAAVKELDERTSREAA
jgi:hypothetical protein